MQLKGKAAIDVVCNPLGKSGGALIQQIMIVSFGSLAASTPYLGGILLVIVLIWIRSANSLDKQFTGALPSTRLSSHDTTTAGCLASAAFDTLLHRLVLSNISRCMSV